MAHVSKEALAWSSWWPSIHLHTIWMGRRAIFLLVSYIRSKLGSSGEGSQSADTTFIALSPSGERAVVTLAHSNQVVVLDVPGRRILQELETGRSPLGAAFTEDGGSVYVTHGLSDGENTYVSELLFDLNREAGTTLVLVTHDLELAARCDRVLKIEAGRLAA